MICHESLLRLSLLALGTDIVPLDISDSTDQIDEELTAKAKKYVERIQNAMAEGTRNLVTLSKKKSFAQVIGRKTRNQTSYAAVHLVEVRNSR